MSDRQQTSDDWLEMKNAKSSDPYLMNRLANCANPYQGQAKKVLCVCSAGLLRSPTAAFVLAKEFGYNTRAVGATPQFALIPVDRVLLAWADEIVCMSDDHTFHVAQMLLEYGMRKEIYTLNIPDQFSFRDPQLEQLILTRYKEETKGTL